MKLITNKEIVIYVPYESFKDFEDFEGHVPTFILLELKKSRNSIIE